MRCTALKEMQKEKKNDLAMDNVIESTKSKYDGGYIPDWLSVNTNGNCICNIVQQITNMETSF